MFGWPITQGFDAELGLALRPSRSFFLVWFAGLDALHPALLVDVDVGARKIANQDEAQGRAEPEIRHAFLFDVDDGREGLFRRREPSVERLAFATGAVGTFDAQPEPLRCSGDTLRHQSVEVCSVAKLARCSEQRLRRSQRREIESAARLRESVPRRFGFRWCGGFGGGAGRLGARQGSGRRATRCHTRPFCFLFSAIARHKTSAGHEERELQLRRQMYSGTGHGGAILAGAPADGTKKVGLRPSTPRVPRDRQCPLRRRSRRTGRSSEQDRHPAHGSRAHSAR